MGQGKIARRTQRHAAVAEDNAKDQKEIQTSTNPCHDGVSWVTLSVALATASSGFYFCLTKAHLSFKLWILISGGLLCSNCSAGQWEAPRVHGGHNDTPHPCVMCAARWALALDAAADADEMGQSIDWPVAEPSASRCPVNMIWILVRSSRFRLFIVPLSTQSKLNKEGNEEVI